MQQPMAFTNPHAYSAMMETLSRDLVKYVSTLNPHRCQNSNLFLKFLMMSILVLLSVVLYVVASNHSMVLGMSRHTYLPLESTSSPSSLQSNASYCLTSTCVQQAAQIMQSLNLAQDPCEDFYEFTCGNWVKRRPITDDQSSITEFGRLRNDLNQKIKKLLNLKVKKKEPLYMEYMRLIYRQCLNTTAIEKEESRPLLEVLRNLDGWPLLNPDRWNRSNFDLIDTLIKIKNLGYSHLTLFSIHPGVDITNNTNYLINIDQCSFSLSSRKYYISNRDNKLLATYRSSIVESALLLNASASKTKVEEYANQITDFEKSLALVAQLPENRRNYTRIYNKMTVAELEEFAPNTDWRRLLAGFTNLPVNDDTVVNVKELEYVRSVDKLLTKTDNVQLANYLIWRVVFSSMPQLNGNWRAIYERLNRIVSGRKSEKQRWSTCMQKLFGSFNVPISALYVKTYFDPKSKKVAEEIINNIKQEFIQMLSALEWMDPSTKARAIKKAEAITTYVGYSPEILDDNKVMELYQGLQLSEKWSYFTNIQKLRRHWADQDFKKLTKKNEKNDWRKFSEAANVNAFYNSLENAVKFPSGILTGIFYDKSRPRYLNYGALGYIVGHEIIHGFDDRGRQFDENGNFKNWWSDETDEKFRKMSNCLVDQYSSYHVSEVNMTVNGALTIGENIADTGGLKQAYNGYRRHVRLNGPDPLLPGLNYTQNQLFWISSSSIWCSNYRPEAMKARITTGVHSPPKYRVIGSIVNNPDFAKDFNCKPGASKMNPSNKRCLIWA